MPIQKTLDHYNAPTKSFGKHHVKYTQQNAINTTHTITIC